MSLFLLHYWGTDLLGIVFLVRLFLLFLSALRIYYPNPFWYAMFLLINLLIVILGTPSYTVCQFFLFSKFSLCLWLWQFYYNISHCGFLQVPPIFCLLSFLNLNAQIWEVFNYYFFKWVFSPFLSLLTFWDPIMCILYIICIMSTYGVPYIP